MTGRIYALLDPNTSEVRYVGQTVQTLRERLRNHVMDARRRSESSAPVYAWIRGILENGGRPEIKLITTAPLQILDHLEVEWIWHYRAIGADLTNTQPGGSSKKVQRIRRKGCTTTEVHGNVISARYGT